MGPNQTYKLLHSKIYSNKKKGKTNYELGENICKGGNRQGLNLRNIHTAHTSQQQKINNPIEK